MEVTEWRHEEVNATERRCLLLTIPKRRGPHRGAGPQRRAPVVIRRQRGKARQKPFLRFLPERPGNSLGLASCLKKSDSFGVWRGPPVSGIWLWGIFGQETRWLGGWELDGGGRWGYGIGMGGCMCKTYLQEACFLFVGISQPWEGGLLLVREVRYIHCQGTKNTTKQVNIIQKLSCRWKDAKETHTESKKHNWNTWEQVCLSFFLFKFN